MYTCVYVQYAMYVHTCILVILTVNELKDNSASTSYATTLHQQYHAISFTMKYQCHSSSF